MLLERFIPILFLVFTCAVTNAQSDTINQKDENGNKQGYWIHYGKERPESDYPAEGKIEEGKYVDNKKQGFWIKYHKDGKNIRVKGEYNNNRPNGRYWKYYQSNVLKEEGSFYRNRYQGTLYRYHENGKLKSQTNYNDEGKEIDTAFRYFDTGCLAKVTIHSTGKAPQVTEYSYEECNKVIVRTINSTSEPISKDLSNSPKFKREPLVSLRIKNQNYKEIYSDEAICDPNQKGYFRKLNEAGDLIFDGSCRDGMIWEGRFYFYKNDGTLYFIEIWREGVYAAEAQM